MYSIDEQKIFIKKNKVDNMKNINYKTNKKCKRTGPQYNHYKSK